MGSSSESDDDLTTPKSTASKKEAPVSYLDLLRSNNKFSEMLKNKIRQSETSPILSKHGFNPVASSTQIGTPIELKQDDTTPKIKRNDSSNSERKSKPKTKATKVVESDSPSTDEASRQKKAKKDRNKHAKSQKAKLVKNKSSESSVDSESDSGSSVSLPGRTMHDSASWEGEKSKERKRSVTSKEPFNKLPKINFSKFNAKESASSKRKQSGKSSSSESEQQAQIKVEVPSDTEAMRKKERSTLKKAKQKPTHEENSSDSSKESESDRSSNQKRLTLSNHNGKSHSLSDFSSHSTDDTASQTKIEKKHHKKLKNNSSVANADSRGEKLLIESLSKISRDKTESSSDESEKGAKTQHTSTAPSSHLRTLEIDDSLEAVSSRFEGFEKLKSNKDVYIIDVPVKLDSSRLIGANISLSGSIRVITKYDSVVSYDRQEPITICDNNESEKFKIVKPVGTLKLQRRLKPKKIPDVPNMADKSVAFPTNLKSRHPLFGSNFDSKIAIQEHIKTKLEAIRDSTVTKKEKKKKRKSETAEHQEEEIFKFLSQTSDDGEHVEKKKKKKKKAKDSECGDEVDSSSSSKKRKREESEDVSRKKNKHRDDSGDTLIQEMLLSQIATLNMPMNKKKKKKKG